MLRTFRAHLFLGIGSLLLVVAILSYLLPEFFIRKNLKNASSYLAKQFQTIEERMIDLSSFFLTYQMVDTAVDLQGITEKISNNLHFANGGNSPSWSQVSQIVAYNPQLAFVQEMQGQKSFVVLPQDTTLYTPNWTA